MNKIFSYFLGSRILFLNFAILAAFFVPLQEGYLGKQSDSSVPYLAWIWANFDGRHFLNIATAGYRNFDFAFFPLYPFAIKILDLALPIPLIYTGIIISLTSFLASLYLLYKLILLDFKKEVAILSISLLAIFPLSFFYQTVYSDSLFLLLAVGSFYFARKKKWILAGILGGLVVLTRIAGVALAPALIIEWWLQNRKLVEENLGKAAKNFLRTGFTASFLAGTGLLFYMLYLWIYFGDPFLFQKSMVAWRQNEFVFPPQVILRYLKIFFLVEKNLLVYWVAVLEFLSMILYFALTFYVWKKIRLSYAVFMFFVLLLPTFTGTFAGMPRYILHAFPAFVGLGLLLNGKKNLQITLFIIFLALGFVFTALFTRGYFIA